MLLTKQNITDRLYKAGLINNTDVQTSVALTELMLPVIEQTYNDSAAVTAALSLGTITPDTYIFFRQENIVDTAQRIVDNY